MKSVTQIKSLGDIKTTITTHARSVPRQEGSTYLEVFLLDKERRRMEAELAMLRKRQGRIEVRLGEIREVVDHLLCKEQQEREALPAPSANASGGEAQGPPGNNAPKGQKWGRMTVEY